MSNIKINLADFKHVKSDDKTTTLRHRHGHEITLAHKGLSKDNQTALKALSKIATQAATDDQHRESTQDFLAEGGLTAEDPNISQPKSEGFTTKKQYEDAKAASRNAEQRMHEGVKRGWTDSSQAPDQDWINSHRDYSQDEPIEKAEGGDIELPKGNQPLWHDKHKEEKAPASVTPLTTRGEHKDQSDKHLTEADHDDRDIGRYHLAMAKYHNAKSVGNHQDAEKHRITADAFKRKLDVRNVKPQFAQGGDVEEANPEAQPQDLSPVAKEESDRYNEIMSKEKQDADLEATKKADQEKEDREAYEQRLAAASPVVASPARMPAATISPAITSGVAEQPKELPASVPNALRPTTIQQDTPPAPTQKPAVTPSQQTGPTVPSTPVLPQVSNQQPPSSMEDAANQGYAMQSQGIQKAGEASANAANAMAKQEQESIAERQSIFDRFKQTQNTLEQERQAHIQDIKDGYIDPEQYWNGDKNGKGGHSRFMAGLGMILAGFNMTGGPNQAVDYINKQIDRNIDAQRQNLNAKQNLYRFNLDHFRNQKDAADMTRLMYGDMVNHQLEALKLKYAGTQAAANAQKAQGELMMSMVPLKERLDMRATLSNIMNDPNNTDAGKQERLINHLKVMAPEQAKQLEEHSIPGMAGFSSRPIPNDVIKQVESHQKLNAALADMRDWVKTHSTVLGNPLDPEYRIGQQKALVLQSILRDPFFGTVYKAQEQPLFDELVNSKNPAGIFKSISTLPQLQNLLDTNQMLMRSTLKTNAPNIERNLPQQEISPATSNKVQPGVQYEKRMINGKPFLVPKK